MCHFVSHFVLFACQFEWVACGETLKDTIYNDDHCGNALDDNDVHSGTCVYNWLLDESMKVCLLSSLHPFFSLLVQ